MEIKETPRLYRILIIDDTNSIHEDFHKILIRQPESDDTLENMESILFGSEISDKKDRVRFEIEYALQGQEGLEKVKKANAEERPFCLVFVDGRMPPGWDGIETIKHLWKESPDLQAVLCTAYADYSWQKIRQVLGEGDNFLILKKPFDNIEVLQMAHALSRKWELAREIKGRLKKLAFYDHLTGLPNRALFLDRLKNTLDYHLRYGHKGSLLFLDLDNFKRINDSLGHSVGDELLTIMADRLHQTLRASDTISRPSGGGTAARLGGDEFTVLLPEIGTQEKAAVVSRRIIENLTKPVTIGGKECIVTPSVGVAIFPDDGDNVEELLKNADLAMYFAKRSGRGNFKYYQDSMNDTALKRLTIENQLRQAIEKDELYLCYQPQVHLPSGELIGMEALLRWNNMELGSVSPAEFIPVAEECGMIIPIGEWVLRQACVQFQKWRKKGVSAKRVAVNVSVEQLTQPGFVDMVDTILKETQMPPKYLEIEITESVFAQNMENICAILNALRSKNILVAVDDFGTGYSSLSRLREMPIDCLKIDRSFISGVDSGMCDKSIVEAIMAMAQGMGLRVIAEGVDKKEQIDFLVDKYCREAQGFFFSQPLPAEEMDEILSRGSSKVIFLPGRCR